jgi:branched-chain amino acid transport system permease protein
MNLASRLKPYNTPLTLVAVILLLGMLTQLLGIPLLIRIVTVMFVSLILVLGLQLYMGNSGILSFAHIGFMGIGAYSSVLFSMTPAAKAMTNPDMYPVLIPLHLPFLPSLLIGALTAAFIAAVIGFPLMRLSDAAAVITTFALLVITHVVLVHWDPVSNGPRTLFGVKNYTNLWTSVVFCVVTILAVYLFKESRVGLRLRATRDDAYAAASIGINMVVMRWLAFIASAFIAGVGGVLWAHYITFFSPYSFYLTETFVILAMLVIGGPYSVSGAVVGTLVVTAVREILRAIENYVNILQIFPEGFFGFTEVVLAIALILILIYRPAGIMGSRELSWPRRGEKGKAAGGLDQPTAEAPGGPHV